MSIGIFSDEACAVPINASESFRQLDALDSGTYKNYRSALFLGSDWTLHRFTDSSMATLRLLDDYTITSGILSLVTGLAANEVLVVLPTSALGLNIGGSQGLSVTKAVPLYLKRALGFSYETVSVFSEDLSTPLIDGVEQADINFTDGVGTGFTGLPYADLENHAVFANGLFVGYVNEATATTVTLDTAGYTATNVVVQILAVGKLEFALDNAGVPGAYAKVLSLPDILDDTPVKVWVRDTEVVPANPLLLPNFQIVVSGTEFYD